MGSGKAPKVEETAQERALADVSRQQWDDYKTRFKPVESQFVDEIRNRGRGGSPPTELAGQRGRRSSGGS